LDFFLFLSPDCDDFAVCPTTYYTELNSKIVYKKANWSVKLVRVIERGAEIGKAIAIMAVICFEA
jgi:hypothetical protein